MTAKKRLIQFIDKQGFTNRKFALEIGISHNYFTKEGAIGSDILSKIVDKYPELNSDWIITGRGSMLMAKEVAGDYILNEVGTNYGVEDWREKYYALLEKYNRCLEVQNAAKTQAS